MTWARVPLSELSETIDYGVTASANPTSGKAKFLRITDIQENRVNWATVPFCDADAKKLRNSRLVDGDIVFARTGATTGKSFLVRRPPEDAVFASYLIRVRASESVTPEYLAHFFDTRDYWSQIKGMAQGAAQEGVNASKLASLQIPLPPLDEQKRIGAILDKADALRAKRRQAIALLDILTQSIFLEMFGDLILGRGAATSIEQVADIQIGPFGSLLHQEDYSEDGIPLVNPVHIVNGMIVPSRETSVATTKYAELKRYHLKAGDVVLGRRGEMGRCAVVGETEHGYVCGTGSMFLRPDTAMVRSEFLAALLRSRPVVRHLENASSGVTMPNLNKTVVAEIKIELPTIERQVGFSKAVKTVSESIKRTAISREEFADLFTSLQQRAFSGQL